MEKIQVKFLKAMYPYNEGDVGYVKQGIVDSYPEYVEPVKTKEIKKEEPKEETTKEVVKAPANKAIGKKETK